MITSEDFAIETVVELAKENIRAAGRWVPQDAVISFMNDIFKELTTNPNDCK